MSECDHLIHSSSSSSASSSRNRSRTRRSSSYDSTATATIHIPIYNYDDIELFDHNVMEKQEKPETHYAPTVDVVCRGVRQVGLSIIIYIGTLLIIFLVLYENISIDIDSNVHGSDTDSGASNTYNNSRIPIPIPFLLFNIQQSSVLILCLFVLFWCSSILNMSVIVHSIRNIINADVKSTHSYNLYNRLGLGVGVGLEDDNANVVWNSSIMLLRKHLFICIVTIVCNVMLFIFSIWSYVIVTSSSSSSSSSSSIMNSMTMLESYAQWMEACWIPTILTLVLLLYMICVKTVSWHTCVLCVLLATQCVS